MLELETAVKLLKKHISPLNQTQDVLLNQGLKCILSRDIFSPINVPSFNRSAMDGYAVKSKNTTNATENVPKIFTVIEQIFAGGSSQMFYTEDNQAIKIATGAGIPDGFNAVVKQEDTDCGVDTVEIYKEVKPFENFIPIGEDIEKGQLIVKKNTQLTPIHLGILASVGIRMVSIIRPLRVGILATGSELAKLGEPLNDGQIYNSTTTMLTADLKQRNVEVVFCEQLVDDVDAVAKSISCNLDTIDFLITTGGVSVGQKDIMHDVYEKLKVNTLFWGINIQPGTPFLSGTLNDKLIVSLSGNPYACLINYQMVVSPLFSVFSKQYEENKIPAKATLMNEISKKNNRRRFVRGFFDGGNVYVLTKNHQSSIISNLIDCNCYVEFPAISRHLPKGTRVTVHFI